MKIYSTSIYDSRPKYLAPAVLMKLALLQFETADALPIFSD